jgi:hypothetical protein
MMIMTGRYSYWDEYTEEQREMVRRKMISEGQSWEEIIKRFGHPKDWDKNALQISLFEGVRNGKR